MAWPSCSRIWVERCADRFALKNVLSHGHSQPFLAGGSNPEVGRLRAQLREFELGRFLLENHGLNGLWTSYLVLHPERGRRTGLSSDGTPLGELERWLLERCPIVVATQERFRMMRSLTQQWLRPGMKLASLPSGLMDDLLTLNYSATPNVELTALDLDPESLQRAEANFNRIAPDVAASFEPRDAWALDATERWDLLTSNGLNIYVEDDDRCTEFYRQVFAGLRPGGLFIVSFMTPPEHWRPRDADDLARQRLLFSEAVPVKWSCFRDETCTRTQLMDAGFKVLEVHGDTQNMFPAVVAQKQP